MKIWDYAEMAKEAKKLGGPEKYADFLVNSGKSEMVPWIVLASLISLGIGVGGTIGIPKLVRYIKGKNNEKKIKVDIAKQELVEKLKEYDLGMKGSEVILVDIDTLLPDDSSLKNYSEDELNKLTNDIKENGIIAPIMVYESCSGYEIITGNRRYYAAKRAGLKRVPVIVYTKNN